MKVIFLISSILLTFASFGLAEAAVTASSNFCAVFPTHSECTGWRVKPINDNFWFCTYVDLPTMCNNPPDPQKQIPALNADYCCRLFNDGLVSPQDVSKLYHDPLYSSMIKKGFTLDESYPINELVIWTDKDHYNFGERINVYGKFDFSDPIIKKSNLSVNVLFNGETVIPNLPVQPNGWFASFFYLDNPRYHTTGLTKVSVPYVHVPTLEYSSRMTTSTYHFTIGNIPEPVKLFSIWLTADKYSIGDPIEYGTNPEISFSSNLKYNLITRITNPDGIAFSLPTNAMKNLDVYMNTISDLRSGNYTISMTVGNFTTHNTFEYGS